MPVYLVCYAKRMRYSEQPTVLLTRRHLNIMLSTNFENSNLFRNTKFLSFEGPTSYLYLFKNYRQTFSWPTECRSSHLKVVKIWFSPNNAFRNSSLGIFAAGKPPHLYSYISVDKQSQLSVHKMLIWCPMGRKNILCTFILGLVSTGTWNCHLFHVGP